jgi:hypothetical protein
MATKARLKALHDDLAGNKPDALLEWPVGLTFNALLEQAKKDHPEDPVVNGIEPVKARGSKNGYVDVKAGTVRALVGQLISAYDVGGSAIRLA